MSELIYHDAIAAVFDAMANYARLCEYRIPEHVKRVFQNHHSFFYVENNMVVSIHDMLFGNDNPAYANIKRELAQGWERDNRQRNKWTRKVTLCPVCGKPESECGGAVRVAADDVMCRNEPGAAIVF